MAHMHIEAKAVQDAIAIATATRTFNQHSDKPVGEQALYKMVVGRSQESIVCATMALAKLLAEAVNEETMQNMAQAFADMDRHAVVVI